jgi:hypothetical protein
MLYINDLGSKPTETPGCRKAAEENITKTNSIMAWLPSSRQCPEMPVPWSQWADRVGRTSPVPTMRLVDPAGYVVTFPSYPESSRSPRPEPCQVNNKLQLSECRQILPASRATGKLSCLCLGRSQVRILVQGPATLAEASRGLHRPPDEFPDYTSSYAKVVSFPIHCNIL